MLNRFLARYQPFNKIATPIVLQSSATECGIAALAIIFSHYNCHVSMEILREKCGSSRDGTKAATLMKVAQEYGFHANAFTVESDFIHDLFEPVIAFWNFSHYVVINGVGLNKVFINDPACGAISVNFDEFDKYFTGIIIDISPTKDCINIKKEIKFLPEIKSFTSGFKLEILFLFLFMLISVSVPFLVSCINTIFIDRCVIAYNRPWIPVLIIISAALSWMLITTTAIQHIVQFKLFAKSSISYSSKVMSHVLNLPLLFYSLRQKSDIISVLTRTEMIVNLLFKSVFSSMMSFLTVLISFSWMIKIDFVLSCVSLAACFISSMLFYFLSKINFSYEKYRVNALSKNYAQSLSVIRNIETIKSCGLTEKNFYKWYDGFCGKISANSQSRLIQIASESLDGFFDSIVPLAILCVGGARLASGYISVGNLMGYYALHLFFYKNALSFFQAVKDSQQAFASSEPINNIMINKKDSRFELGKKQLIYVDKVKYAVMSEDLIFFYNKSTPPTIKNINLHIKQGEHVAFVGGTGSGKSTVVKLISCLYPVHGGEVFLSGVSSVDLSPDEISKKIAYVSQEVSLFSGTIFDNLTLWRKDIDFSKVTEAIRIACLDDLIALRGLYARVEEGGNNFSGGEKQRIDIARALIQDTSMIVLDEATSALDSFTEIKIINNLRKTNKTFIFVAHRLSSIAHCDQIFVMKEGEIIERGRHDDLLKLGGSYCHLNEAC